jgi:cytochrome c oxidase subunit 3
MTTAALPADHPESGANSAAHAATARFGMIIFLLSEAMLFAGIIAAYVVLRVSDPGEWPPAGYPSIQVTSWNPAQWHLMNWVMIINSIILISSSFVYHWAEHSIKHRGKSGVLPLFLTLVMGTIFLSVQAWEWIHLHHEGLWFNTGGIYGSAFFITTGFHGLHVLVGLFLILWVLGRQVFTRCYKPGQTASLDNVGLYWHFVDVVWIVVFISFYVI